MERVAQEPRMKVTQSGVERSKWRVKGSQGHYVTVSS